MTTQHTVESLMALVEDAHRYGKKEWEALFTALTEVFDALAEAKQKMVDGVTIQQYIDMDNQVDTLQSKCDSQALEIEQLKSQEHDLIANCDPAGTVRELRQAKDVIEELSASNRMLRDKIAAMESQGTQHFSNLSNQAHGFNLTGAVPAVLNAGVTHQVSYLAPGATQEKTE